MIGQLRRRLAGRSAGEVVALAGKNLRHALRTLSPAQARARRAAGAFDRQWGTETTGLANLSQLKVDRERAKHGIRYQPSSGEAVDWAIAAAGTDPARTTFVDYGAGKRRIAMIAARRGFAPAIGVEFSPQLCAVADANVEIFMAQGGAEHAPRIVAADAGEWTPPPGDLIAYFYNPFGPVVLDEVVARLTAHAATGAWVHALYVEPVHLDRFAGWARVAEGPGRVLMRA